MAVRRVVGVYDADGTLAGELSYLVRRQLGLSGGHCALCDITHHRIREKAGWRACTESLAFPFETLHRDDPSAAELSSALGVPPPFVAAEIDDGDVVLLLDSADLSGCAGSVDALLASVEGALDRLVP